MAEGKEGGGKAADIYLGVVDLFAIILPGALFALVLWAVLKASHTDLFKGTELPEFLPPWLLFLICAYVLGHFVSAFGSWVMDYLYDAVYKHYYEFQVKKEIPSLRRRADYLIREALGPRLYKEGDNRLTWGESFLLLSSAAGIAKLDRQEADSKFFRSLAAAAILSELVCFSPLTSWAPLDQYMYRAPPGILALVLIVLYCHGKIGGQSELTARVKANLKAANKVAIGPVPSDRLDWPDEDWLTAEREERERDIQRNKGFAFVTAIAWVVYAAMMAAITNDPRAWIASLVCWVLAVMSALRFMQLRGKRLAQGYYLTIALQRKKSFGGATSEPIT